MTKGGFRETGLQALRFGAVGFAATATHVGVAALAHWAGGLAPQGANLAGFVAALGVTYLGNQRWTFGGRAPHRRALGRFPAMAAVSLAGSGAATWIATGPLGLGFGWALALVAVAVPALSFALARYWVFRA